MFTRDSPVASILEAVASWWFGLVAIAFIGTPFLTSNVDAAWLSWETGHAVVASLSTLLPYALFAGGLAASSLSGRMLHQVRVLALATIPLIAFGYVTGEFVGPWLEYRASLARGDDVQQRFPFGPNTPLALSQRRTVIVADPPASFRLSVERPLEQPPNWLTYRLHFPIAFAVFGILNTLLGLVVGLLTSGLDPPVRRQTRWAVGLASAVAFFAPATLAGVWVRSSATHSALFGVWAPLALPVLCVAIAIAVWVRSERSFTEHPDVFEP